MVKEKGRKMTNLTNEKAVQPKSIHLTSIRKTTAERLVKSHMAAPHVTIMMEVDVTDLSRFRDRLLEQVRDVRISYTDILVKACVGALKAYPIVNSRFESDQIRFIEQINVGVAVAIEPGLIVPVIRNAGEKSLIEISKELGNLVSKACKGHLTLDEVTGGTFTITNLGMFRVDAFTPIINPPESAILGVGRIVEKPLVIDGKIEVRSTMVLSLTFDHRVMDGAVAAQFLGKLTQILEKPEDTDYFIESQHS